MTAFSNLSNTSSASTYMESLEQIVWENSLITATYGSPINQMINQIEEVFKESSVEGWDGYGARAVSQRTQWLAATLTKYFPSDIPVPEFGADSDGHLSFEWYKGPRKIVTVCISPDGVLYYAALIGDVQTDGSAYWVGGFPNELLDLIHQVVSE